MIKKQNIIIAATALAFVGCTSAPYAQGPSEPRNPAGIGQQSLDSVGKSATEVSQVAVNSFKWSVDGVSLAAGSAVDLLKAGSDLTVAGVGISGEVASMVFDASKAAPGQISESAKAAGNWIVTTSGKVFRGSVNAGRSVVNTSVDISADSWETSKSVAIKVWDSSRTVIIGTVEVSGRAAEKVWGWSKAAPNFVMDTAGNLIHSSGEVVGKVYDETGSKAAVGFVVDSTGKILTVASEKTVYVVTSTSDKVVDFAKSVWRGMKAAPGYSVEVAKASAQGTMVIIKASVNGSQKSIQIVSNVFYQDKYDNRPAVSTGSAQSN